MNDQALSVSPDDKAAYVKAQKQRNLYIGLGLFAFVLLVFAVSVIRMTEGIARDRAVREAGLKSQMSNVPAEAPAQPKP